MWRHFHFLSPCPCDTHFRRVQARRCLLFNVKVIWLHVAEAAAAAAAAVSDLFSAPLYAPLGSNGLQCPHRCLEQVFLLCFCRVTLALGCSISSAWALGEMHMSSESRPWPPDLAQTLYGLLNRAMIRPIRSRLVTERTCYLQKQRGLSALALEKKVQSASPCTSTPRHFWCSHKRKNNNSGPVQ